MKICGVIPAFNSEPTIAHVVKETKRHIDHFAVPAIPYKQINYCHREQAAGKRGYPISFVPVKTIYFPDNHYQSFYRPIYDTFRICIIFLRNLFWKNR